MNDSKLSTLVIFGATGGIGSALVRRLRGRFNLVLSGRNEETLISLAEKTDSWTCVADATRAQDVEHCFQEAQKKYTRVDGTVHCVGSLLLKPAHITTENEWEQTIRTNLTSAFHVVKFAAKAMMKAGGSIVLISSAAARAGMANHEAIAAAKAGIVGLTLSAAASYSQRGIRVNCVAPGLVRSPLTEKMLANPVTEKASVDQHSLGRLGEPDDVAEAIVWLLESRWVTGQVIGIDGGLATVRRRLRA